MNIAVITSNPAILCLSGMCWHVALTEDGHSIFLNNVGTYLPDYLGVRATTPWAMAWLRQLVATLATWSLRFNLWWGKFHWDRFCFKYFRIPLSLSFHCCSIAID